MYTRMDEVTLKSGERAVISRIHGPDGEWAKALVPFLGHKGEPWKWQISETLEKDTAPLESYYYVALVDGKAAANICTYEYRGVGILGHVFTAPEHRRKGLASVVMGHQMDDFRARGGKALVLGTGYDTPPWHIYHGFGFRPLHEGSGEMAYYTGEESSFDTGYYRAGPSTIRAADWRDWPALSILTSRKDGSPLRHVGLSRYGRTSMEHSFLVLYRMLLGGKPASAAVLESDATGADAGFATRMPDSRFPGVSTVDLFVRPEFRDRGNELLSGVIADAAGEKLQGFAETDDGWKISAYEKAGFTREAVLRGQLRLGGASADVTVMCREP